MMVVALSGVFTEGIWGIDPPIGCSLLVSLIMLVVIPPHFRGNYVFQRISPLGQNPKYATGRT